MRAFWSDPYLWIHAAGLAVVPLLLGICLLGLAVGDPWLPSWVELGLIAVIGIAPIAWMQWQRPFYIFSLLAITLKPDHLTEDQRRLLSLFQARKSPVVIGLGSVLLLILLTNLYNWSPIAAEFAPFAPNARGLGLVLAALAFLASNLFLQVPLSVLQVLLTSDEAFAATSPYPLEKILPTFTTLGVPVKRILPELLPFKASASATMPPVPEVATGGVPDASSTSELPNS